jgi:hypothetical protein
VWILLPNDQPVDIEIHGRLAALLGEMIGNVNSIEDALPLLLDHYEKERRASVGDTLSRRHQLWPIARGRYVPF